MIEQLQKIRVVLVETSHPGNIGASARALKTMGLEQLHLVNPQQYPCAEATARASSANDLLARATVHTSLEQAIADCSLVIGSSARERRLQWPTLSAAEAAELVMQHNGQAALIFGREKYGLTNEELARCQYLLTIDANPEYSSLNLAAAVQLISYELRVHARQIAAPSVMVEPDEPAATSAELEGMFEHLQQTLDNIGIQQPGQPKATLMRRLRRLFNRACLTQTEVNILRGIFSAAQGKKGVRGDS